MVIPSMTGLNKANTTEMAIMAITKARRMVIAKFHKVLMNMKEA